MEEQVMTNVEENTLENLTNVEEVEQVDETEVFLQQCVDTINTLLALMTDVGKKLGSANSFLSDASHRLEDDMHELELNNPSDERKLEIANSIIEDRQDRRYWKDIVESLKPVQDTLNATSCSTGGTANCYRLLVQLQYELQRRLRLRQGLSQRTYVIKANRENPDKK